MIVFVYIRIFCIVFVCFFFEIKEKTNFNNLMCTPPKKNFNKIEQSCITVPVGAI